MNKNKILLYGLIFTLFFTWNLNLNALNTHQFFEENKEYAPIVDGRSAYSTLMFEGDVTVTNVSVIDASTYRVNFILRGETYGYVRENSQSPSTPNVTRIRAVSAIDDISLTQDYYYNDSEYDYARRRYRYVENTTYSIDVSRSDPYITLESGSMSVSHTGVSQSQSYTTTFYVNQTPNLTVPTKILADKKTETELVITGDVTNNNPSSSGVRVSASVLGASDTVDITTTGTSSYSLNFNLSNMRSGYERDVEIIATDLDSGKQTRKYVKLINVYTSPAKTSYTESELTSLASADSNKIWEKNIESDLNTNYLSDVQSLSLNGIDRSDNIYFGFEFDYPNDDEKPGWARYDSSGNYSSYWKFSTDNDNSSFDEVFFDYDNNRRSWSIVDGHHYHRDSELFGTPSVRVYGANPSDDYVEDVKYLGNNLSIVTARMTWRETHSYFYDIVGTAVEVGYYMTLYEGNSPIQSLIRGRGYDNNYDVSTVYGEEDDAYILYTHDDDSNGRSDYEKLALYGVDKTTNQFAQLYSESNFTGNFTDIYYYKGLVYIYNTYYKRLEIYTADLEHLTNITFKDASNNDLYVYTLSDREVKHNQDYLFLESNNEIYVIEEGLDFIGKLPDISGEYFEYVKDNTFYTRDSRVYSKYEWSFNTPPQITIDNYSTTKTYQNASDFNITGNVNDVDGDTVTVSATINGVTKSTTVSGSGSYSLSWLNSDISNGTYSNIVVTADDSVAGSNSQIFTDTLIIDNLSPNVPTLNMSEAWINGNRTFTLSDNGDNGNSGINKMQYKIDTGSWTDYVSTTTARSTTGTSTVYVRAIDNAGNISAETSKIAKVDEDDAVLIDTQPSGYDYNSGSDLWIKQGNSMTIRIDADDYHSGLERYYIQIVNGDNRAYHDFDGNVFGEFNTSSYTDITGSSLLSEVGSRKNVEFTVEGLSSTGLSNLNLYLRDNVNNNYGYFDSGYNIGVDGTNPSTPTLSFSNITENSIDLSWNVFSDAHSGYNRTRIYAQRWNGSSWVNEVDIDGDSSNEYYVHYYDSGKTTHTMSGLTPGNRYRFYVRYYDNVGNYSNSGWIEKWTVPAQMSAPSGIVSGLSWSNVAGRGKVELTWPDVTGATGYKIFVFDGRSYRTFDVGDVNTFDTSIEKIYPAESTISSYGDNTRSVDIFKHDKTGLDLRDDPNALYVSADNSGYNNRHNYWFRIAPYNSSGRPSYSGAYMPTLPDRTDKVDPDATFTPNEEPTWQNSDISFTIDYSDDESGVNITEWSWSDNNGSTWSSWNNTSNPANLTFTTSGYRKARAKIVDNAGNEKIVESGTYLLDKIEPTITFVTNGNSTYEKSQSTVVNVTDSLSGISNLEYKWSTSTTTPSSGWTTFTNGDTLSIDSVTGDYYLHIRATDNVGNISNSHSNVFKLDNTIPNISFSENGNTTYYKNHTTDVNVTDTESGVGTLSYQITGNNTFPTSGTWTTFTNGDTITLDSNTGDYYLHIKAIDSALNENTRTSNVFKLDNEVPTQTVSYISGARYVDGNDYWVKEGDVINFKVVSEDNLAGPYRNYLLFRDNDLNPYRYHRFDDVNGNQNTHTKMQFNSSTININDGTTLDVTFPVEILTAEDMNVSVEAITDDRAGYNRTGGTWQDSSMRVKTDNTSPQVPNITFNNVTQTSVNLSFTAFSDALSGYQKTTIFAQKWNGSTWVNEVDIDGDSTYEYSVDYVDELKTTHTINGLIAGEKYRFYVRYHDNCDNQGNSGWQEKWTLPDVMNEPIGENKGILWDQTEGRGRVKLSWPDQNGATGYKVAIYDGTEYRTFDVGDVNEFDTYDHKIYPTESTISSYADNTRSVDIFKHDKTGLDLRDDPNELYVSSDYSGYNDRSNYWFRLQAYNSSGSTSYSPAYMPTLPDRTDNTAPSISISGNPTEYTPNSVEVTVEGTDTESGVKKSINPDLSEEMFTINDTLLSISDWTLGTNGTQGIFDKNGSDSENEIILKENPWGVEDITWATLTNDSDGNSDGGWTAYNIPIDNTKKYRLTVWIRRENVGDGRTYFGTQSTVTNLGSSVTNTNPYFKHALIGELPELENNWLLFVAHIHPHDYTKTVNDIESGIYDINGNKVSTLTDFKWTNTATVGGHRSYLYYSTSINERQYWYRPRFEKITGSEPSLDELLKGQEAKLTETNNYTIDTNGSYTFKVEDAAENVGETTINVTKIDKESPLISNISNTETVNSISVNVTASDSLSGLKSTDTYEYLIKEEPSGSYINEGKNSLNTHTYNNLKSNTEYTVKVKAEDSVGNIGENTKTILTSYKDVNIVVMDKTYDKIEFAVFDDNETRVDTKIILKDLDDNIIAETPFNTDSKVELTGLDFIDYKIEYKIRDLRGNESENIILTEKLSLGSDKIAPQITKLEANYGDAVGKKTDIDLELVATDNTTNTENLKVKFEFDGDYLGYTGNNWVIDTWGEYNRFYSEFPIGIIDYDKTLRAHVKDDSNNIEIKSVLIKKGKVDNEIPEVDMNSTEDNDSPTSGLDENEFKVTDEGYIMTRSRLVKVEVRARNAEYAQYSLHGIEWSPWELVRDGKIDKYITLDEEPGDIKTIYVRTKNDSGNISSIEKTHYIVDQEGPEATIKSANSINIAVNGEFNLRIDAKDEVSKDLEYEIYLNENMLKQGTMKSGSSVTESLTGISEGFHTIKVKMTDELQNSEFYKLKIWSK